MTRPKLTYFDSPASRGEECRLALHIAGVDFEDVRIKGADWPALKPTTPFGGLPLFELPGRPVLAQSNAILTYIGRTYGLHPADNFEAAHHEALMHYAEELRHLVAATMRMPDEEKRARRQELVAGFLPAWGANVERQLAGADPFVAGAKLCVVDIKLYMIVRWFVKGGVDHIPATIFAEHGKLVRLYDAVSAHDGLTSWYAKLQT